MGRGAAIAAILLLCVAGHADAGEMAPPRIARADVDWARAAEAIGAVVASRSLDAAAAPRIDAAMARLNGATAVRLPGIAQSPIPVLLPFDIDAFMRDRSQVGLAQNSAPLDPPGDPDATYYAGFGHPDFFAAGPSGFDAAFRFSLASVPGLADVHFARTAEIEITGSLLVYDLDPPVPDQGKGVPALEADFPGIRRSYAEDYVRYTFVRYGVPYMVSTVCFDSAYSRFRHMACRDADRVIQLFLHKLRIVGGMPRPVAPFVIPPVRRPAAASPTFTYYGPGRLIPGTGYRGNAGRADATVYSNIRFPLAEAPAFANTQYFGRRVPGGVRAYPWRDNFCESRSFYVSQCPGGAGHQGQDIGAGGCSLASLGDDRCTEHRNDVLAVRDGAIMRAPGQESVWLIVNTANEHIRFRYLHMRPKLLDADGVVSGRVVKAGEVIGPIGNYSGHENGTSYHLHFDVQVPTRVGWIYVNPYMTLVAAYERLIGGRGAELTDDVIASAATTVNDASVGGAMITLASVRHAILGAAPVAPVVEATHRAATRCGWRHHWRGCAMRQVARAHGLHRHAWHFRRHHI
ncbi:MAG TPA: peptidoglycan DD-metalloendopeptidase family protein [Xanthobacteraceae bacterium]|jgi:murein DD-endopeptidase MepM/ murein hydrolase activator NlpD